MLYKKLLTITCLTLLVSFFVVLPVQAQDGTILPEHKGFVPDCERTVYIISEGGSERKIYPEELGNPNSANRKLVDDKLVRIESEGKCGLCQVLNGFGRIFNWLLTFGMAIAFIMFVFGGLGFAFTWGRPAEEIPKNKKLLLHTFLGLIFLFASWFLVHVIILIFTNGFTSLDINGQGNWFEPDYCKGSETSQQFQTCKADGSNDNAHCGDNSVCSKGVCLAECVVEHGQGWGCGTPGSCLDQNAKDPGKCPGDENNVCCQR